MSSFTKKIYASSIESIEIFDKRNSFKKLHKSEKYFLNRRVLNNNSILDIGCSTGALGHAITSKIKNVKYTGIDVNKHSIQIGKKKYKNLSFIHGSFPDALGRKKYDIIIVNNLFEQIDEWKKFLLSLKKHSIKYLIIGCCVKLSGPTVIDKDVSYSYYFETGQRVHKIVHNMYELINYCCINEMGAENIDFFGYHISDKKYVPGDFKPLPVRDQIRGNLMIKFSKSVKKSKGSFNYQSDKNSNIRNNINIIIDGKNYKF